MTVTTQVYGWSSPSPRVCGIQCLDHRHHVADEPEDRPDREVDVARHDDEHHARGHDADRGALDREVPEVARRQEKSAGDEVEPDPDDARAAIIPNRRVSTSVAREHGSPRCSAPARPSVLRSAGGGPASAFDASWTARRDRRAPCAAGTAAQGAVADRSARACHGQPSTEPARRPGRASLVDPAGVEHDVQVVLVTGADRAGSRSTCCHPGVVNGAVPATAVTSGSSHRASAASPAALPSSRASFQTLTVCVPRATRFRAA